MAARGKDNNSDQLIPTFQTQTVKNKIQDHAATGPEGGRMSL